MLKDYARGKELIAAEELEAGIELWRKAAGSAENQAADGLSKCWLLLRIGDAWGRARQWKKAHGAYRSALETTQDPVAQGSDLAGRRGRLQKRRASLKRLGRLMVSAQEIRQRTWGESLALASGPELSGNVGLEAGQARIGHRAIGSALWRFVRSWRPAASPWQRA